MLFASTGLTVSPGQIDCTTISTRSTASGAVAMIMSTAITVSGMTGNGSGCSVANRRRPDVAEAERAAEPVPEAAAAGAEAGPGDGREDAEAVGEDREPDREDREREDRRRPVRPGAVERERIEEHPRSREAHPEARDDDAGDADRHRPPARDGEPPSPALDREAALGQDPPADPHERERGPADERRQAVGRHDLVPQVRRDPVEVGLALAQEHAEQAARAEQDRRGDEVAEGERPDARDVDRAGRAPRGRRARGVSS